MLVPDDVRKCVVFLAVQLADRSYRFIGTAFLFSRSVPDAPGHFGYFITAKHVIDKAADLGIADVYLRFNWITGGFQWFKAPIKDWLFHPSDAAADVAVYRSGPADQADHLLYPIEHVVTTDRFGGERIGLGTEVFLAGLFYRHIGEHRNIPIIRVGNIAALPEEPIRSELGPMRAILVEARSIGGLSGSPVFANVGNLQLDQEGRLFGSQGPVVRFIGLMHGHYEVVGEESDVLSNQNPEDEDRIHTGIGVVVPAEVILEVLNQPAIAAHEARIASEVRQKRGGAP